MPYACDELTGHKLCFRLEHLMLNALTLYYTEQFRSHNIPKSSNFPKSFSNNRGILKSIYKNDHIIDVNLSCTLFRIYCI